MSAYPTGITPAMLDEVIRDCERGESLSSLLRVTEFEAGLSRDELVRNNVTYWYLFDRLTTAAAQHLWVLRKNIEIARKRDNGFL
jgi:hypothetical protein